MTTENAAYLESMLNVDDSNRPGLHKHMATIVRERPPSTIETATERLRGLNDIVIRTFQRGTSPLRSSAPRSFQPSQMFERPVVNINNDSPPSHAFTTVDETIVVVNASDGDVGSSNYEFVIRFNAAFASTKDNHVVVPTHKELTLDGVVRHCISIEPIAAFIPVMDDLRDEPFLVLETDIPSRNRLISTKGSMNGTHIVMVPPTGVRDETSKYDQYTNLTGTVLRPTKPQRRLSAMTLRLVRSEGGPIVETHNIQYRPRLILRLKTSVPQTR